MSDKLYIKNATKKGYIEATEGDFVNLQFPTSNTRRGRVIKQCSGTLLTNDGNGVVVKIDDSLTIRKLTSSEYFKLMGFSVEDRNKCFEGGISNSQLYKQAGNSIVVNVLESIFSKLGETYTEFRA